MKRIYITAIALMFVLLAALPSTQASEFDQNQPSTTEISPVNTIASYIKGIVEGISSDELYALMEHQYVRIHFLDREGNWKHEDFEEIADQLLPPYIATSDALDFIDEIASNLNNNPMLVDFLTEASDNTFSSLFDKIEMEGLEIIPDLVAWAMVLENITKAQLDNPLFLGVTTDFWIQERKNEGITWVDMGVFGAIKLQSVQIPMKQLVHTHRTGDLDPKLWRGMLPLNIWEATFGDQIKGNWDNASAGWALYRNAPGERTNVELGTGPATFTEDMKRIEIRMALPKQWADLYQVWNMAFLSQIPNYPYWIAKLLIPQVTNYDDHPEEYIYRRAISLYTSEQFIFLGGMEDEKDGVEEIDWVDRNVTKSWGKVNKRWASDYQQEVYSIRY